MLSEAVRLRPDWHRPFLTFPFIAMVVSLPPLGRCEDIKFSESEATTILGMSPLPDQPRDSTNKFADDPRAARLGQFLFFDRRLSANGQVSCATCHDPEKAFADALPLGKGMGQSERHAPALWNVAYNRWYFWDGRADSLWSQALKPMESPRELGSSREKIVRLIHDDADLRKAYEQICGAVPEMRVENPDTVSQMFANVGKFLEAYERKLISRNSPFDQFVDAIRRNDETRIASYPMATKRGLRIFIGRGNCRLCHSGPNFTDGEFHDTRLPTPDGGPPRDAGRHNGIEQLQKDPFNATGAFSDDCKGDAADRLGFLASNPQNWGSFKTPTLRNVALTAPYMHNGQFATLRDVLNHYSTMSNAASSHHPEQILKPLNLTEQEIDDLIAFLTSLTDVSIDAQLMHPPESPY